MKLDSRKTAVITTMYGQALNASWKSQAKPPQQLQASTWVKLRELPSPYSHDEALLLCQHSETEWVVWIPECGEMVLHRCQLGEA